MSEALQRVREASELEEFGILGAIPEYPVEALPAAAQEVVEYGRAVGLPPNLIAGSVLAALAAAIGGNSQIRVTPTWHERAILWVANIAPRGAGKSPAQDLGFDPLRKHDDQADEDEVSEILLGEHTLEALARTLNETGGSGALDCDELSVFLRGIGGEYKRGQIDVGRWLQLWSGARLKITRVGSEGKAKNAVKLKVPEPTLVICGGLQPELDELLGEDIDGMRPRWLPHLAPMPNRAETDAQHPQPVAWQILLGGRIIPARPTSRTWHLGKSAWAAFERHREAWLEQERATDSTASVSAALGKAPRHLARIALVLAEAEAENPGAGGEISAELVERSTAIMDFVIDCWRALPEHRGLALTKKDEILDKAISRLIAWLEQHGDKATKRQLQRAMVAGARTTDALEALLKRYGDMYPGCVIKGKRSDTTIVFAPSRRPAGTVSNSRDICKTAKNLATEPDSAADTSTADTSADSPQPSADVLTVARKSADTSSKTGVLELDLAEVVITADSADTSADSPRPAATADSREQVHELPAGWTDEQLEALVTDEEHAA